MSQEPQDFICKSAESDCCGAAVMSGGMCAACGEHCEILEIEENE
jgi:hypothetical protein